MIAPLALAFEATAPALSAADALEASATFARPAVAERPGVSASREATCRNGSVTCPC